MSLSNLGPALINMGYGAFQNKQSMGPLAMLGIGAAQTGINTLLNQGATRRNQDFQLKLWQMNNEYNHPSEQMARLRKAGLNPNLMYGQGTVGNSATPAKAPNEEPQRFEALESLLQGQNIKQMEAQTDNLRAQNTLLTQQKLLNVLEARSRGEDIKSKATRNEFLADQLQATLSGQQSDAALKGVLSSLNQMEYQFVQENQELFIKYLESKYAAQALQNEGQSKLNAIRELERFIKNDMKEWTTTNQAAGFAARIAQIISKL